MAFSIKSARQKQKFKENLEIDMAYSVPGLGRFRVNCFQQRGAVGMVFRVVPVKIPTVRELTLPTVLEQIASEARGLILVTGTTGSGKSTTLAAMIDYINATRCEHIMTIEDPIEYVHQHKQSIVNQREVGSDTASFAGALKYVLRQDPDVILIGEMRDLETMQAALTIAETGHLVFATPRPALGDGVLALEHQERVVSIPGLDSLPRAAESLGDRGQAVVVTHGARIDHGGVVVSRGGENSRATTGRTA